VKKRRRGGRKRGIFERRKTRSEPAAGRKAPRNGVSGGGGEDKRERERERGTVRGELAFSATR